MCGICGIWGDGDKRAAVNAMTAAMHHRGPDDNGVLFDESVGLGMTRLAIIDMSPGGHQPMQNPQKTISIVYNGELYNFRTEREILEAKGFTFTSSSDTEVILRMYEHYGDDFVQRLRGMFALAVYDKRRGPGRERLLLARDHLGIKPLLYARVGGRLVFASEVKALLASGLVEPRVDPVALRLLLTYGSVYQPRTILSGVSMLPPAHRMIIEGGRERVERFWSLGIDRREGLRVRPYEELVEEVAAVLEESVRLQMVSDVPLGAFLSGGIDSSLLVAMMARTTTDHRIKTFSVGFEAEGSHIDESDEAERTARFLGTDHTRMSVRGEDVRDRIRHIAYSLDQPSVDGVNSYFVSMAARRAVTVAISGTGGDEFFAGYPSFIAMALDEKRRRGEPWKAAAKSLLSGVAGQPALDRLLFSRFGGKLLRVRGGDFITKYVGGNHIFNAAAAAKVIGPELRGRAQVGRSTRSDLNAIDELSGGSALERVTGLCQRGYTNNQLLRDIDAMSMAHSLEVRVPYLDPVVADTALSLPDGAKMGQLKGLETPAERSYRETGAKRILLDIGCKLLPEGFDRQPKRGFLMPFDAWLRGPLQEVLHDALSESSVSARGLLAAGEVSAVKDGFLEGRVGWPEPWLLMMVELWCREVLDQPPLALSHPYAAEDLSQDACRTAVSI